MGDHDHLADFGAALAAYLSALEIAGECAAAVCPEVGKPSGQRLGRLRTRLAFKPEREAIRDSVETLRRELKHYAISASMQVDRKAMESRRGMAALQQIAVSWAQREKVHSSQLDQIAEQLENVEYPSDPEQWKAACARHAAAIRQYGETLASETAAVFEEMRGEITAVEERLADAHTSDPVTGLLTREEILRRIQALRAEQVTHTLVVIQILGPASDTVLRQAAAKLGTQFRRQDMLARWSEREFLVVFYGEAHLAEARIPRVTAWVAGRYQDEGLRAVEIAVAARLAQQDLVAA